MRWFWQRRKPEQKTADASQSREKQAQATMQAPAATLTIERASGSGRLAGHTSPREPRDALLRFARDFLLAQGARVRLEDDEKTLTATLADGATTRYTTSLARAHAEEATILLVEGSAALATLSDEAARRSRVVALRLVAEADPAALVAKWLGLTLAADSTTIQAATQPNCWRCLGFGGEPWRRGAPSCQVCPLHAGRLAIRWEQTPVAARIVRRWEAPGVELTLLVSGRDRRGRREEWQRLAFDTHGKPLAPLTLEQMARASGAAFDLAAQSEGQRAQSGPSALIHASYEQARATLAPVLDAASVFLQQRAADDYQRRVADLTAHYERLRHEEPDQADDSAAALTRELDSLSEVFAVEVEARLENVALIAAPLAEAALRLPSGAEAMFTVDLGRSVVVSPVCGVCGKTARVGGVCRQGHFTCAECFASCAHCGAHACAICAGQAGVTTATLTPCATCGEAICQECLHACAQCGTLHCPAHLWQCKDHPTGADGGRLCLACAALCSVCDGVLCAEHALACSECGALLCQEHALACGECAALLCGAHARRCVTCQRPVCSQHASTCEACGSTMCASDTFACSGCGRALCKCATPAACALCQIPYCAYCLNPNASATLADAHGKLEASSSTASEHSCPACRSLSAASDADLTLLKLAATHGKAINLRHRWLVGRNARLTVFVDRGLGRQVVFAITPEGEIIGAQRKGWFV